MTKYDTVSAVYQGRTYDVPEWFANSPNFVQKVLEVVGYPNPAMAAQMMSYTVTSSVCLNITKLVALTTVWDFEDGEVIVTGKVYWERQMPRFA